MSVARVGVEPTGREGLSFAALPVCVPRCSALIEQASPIGFEPTTSTVTGWRALLAALRGRVVCWCPEQESNLQTHGFKPSRSADWRIRAQVVPDGLEPPLPGCRPGVVAAGPRDYPFGAEAVGLEPTTVLSAPVFKTGSSSGRMTSVLHIQFRGLESNQRPPGSEPGVTTSSNCPGSHLHERHAPLALVRGQIGEQDLNLHRRVQSPAACR